MPLAGVVWCICECVCMCVSVSVVSEKKTFLSPILPWQSYSSREQTVTVLQCAPAPAFFW